MIDWSLLFIPSFFLFMAWVAHCAYLSNVKGINKEWGRTRNISVLFRDFAMAWLVWWLILALLSLALILPNYYKVLSHA